ncbi:MAG: FAD-dependent oxidoreductase [Acidobacteriota bacterium]
MKSSDVIVVGGGVIGCAVVWELTRRGVRTLLVDRALPGRATSASAGGLWPIGEAVGLGCGVIYHAAQHAGDASAEASDPEPLPAVFRDFLHESNALFPELAVELREQGGFDMEFERGAGLLFAIYNERERAFVERVDRSLPPEVSLEILDPREVAEIEPQLTRDLIGGALLAGEYQVNPMAVAEAFKRAAIRGGATFRHGTRVRALRREGNRVVGVEIDGEVLTADTVVNAAGAWAGGLAETIGLDIPVVPVRGQIVLTETLPHTLNACLSTSQCYIAQKQHGEVLIGSTTEHVGFDVGVSEEATRSLSAGAIRAVPLLSKVRVKRVWAGLRPGTPDELPVLGPVEGLEGYVNATGGFRTGIVAAPLTAQVVVATILEPSSALAARAEPFALRRFEPAVACA